MKKLISNIVQQWFLSEPLLFNIFCTHELIENQNINIPFRTGKKRIEYNSRILKNLSSAEIEEYLKIELIRIMLKHPYQRQPMGAKKPYLTAASDATIYGCCKTNVRLEGAELIKEWITHLIFMENYLPGKFKKLIHENTDMLQTSIIALSKKKMVTKTKLQLHWIHQTFKDSNGLPVFPTNLSFEEWYTKLITMMDFTDEEGAQKIDNDAKNSIEKLEELSKLWEEDEITSERINEIIEDAERAAQWGSISGELKHQIIANKIVELNYSEILRHFSTSIISSKRYLTRMKPNRRFDFDRQGSRYKIVSRILIAVDVSSSITNENLEYAFSVINQFFKYGVEDLDVIQFSTELLGNPNKISKALNKITILGKGGTDFQPAADFFCTHKEYDGLIYFTDGFAFPPKFHNRQKLDVLWIFTSKVNFDKGRKWAEKIRGNFCTYIPLP